MNTKYCSKCKATEVPLMKYAKPRDIQYYRCRECANQHQKDYYSSATGKQSYIKKNKKYYLSRKNTEKQKSRLKLNYAVKMGRVIKPEICDKCHELPTTRIEAHHADYSKPLIVDWLCTPCHSDVHRVAIATSM